MSALDKIWIVVEAISDALEIAPEGKPCRIHSKTIWQKVNKPDLGYILEKLEQDERVIQVIKSLNEPFSDMFDTDDAECYVLEVLPGFTKYRDNLYAKKSAGLDSLNDGNIIKILDVCLDIKEELEMAKGNEVGIKYLPNIIRFQGLMPIDSISFRDQYCEYRWKSVGYLKENGIVEDFDLDAGSHRWDSEIVIKIKNRFEFDRFLTKLQERYKKIHQKIKETKEPIKREAKDQIDRLKYESTSHTLKVGGIEIVFNKDDSNQAELCRVIFENKATASHSWNTDEMLEAWGWPEDRIFDQNGKLLEANRLKVYHAAEKINTKVMKATEGKIPELLKYSTKTVCLNPDHVEMLANNS